MEDEIATSGTQNKRKQIKINQNKVNHLPNPPQGGDEGGKYLKSRTAVTQEDIDCLQPPCDGVQLSLIHILTDGCRCRQFHRYSQLCGSRSWWYKGRGSGWPLHET